MILVRLRHYYALTLGSFGMPLSVTLGNKSAVIGIAVDGFAWAFWIAHHYLLSMQFNNETLHG